ncbi:hypothetical protein MAGR_64830 [Mycolicibacterium agri]|uniref:HNH endonuclease n=1 Tax=Mycolicibacterium agri TaxID=36811 RepID=A0A7I9WBD6_MYCAG|nr:hypothetical protein MAGR_64830 [Mycolicibacterium agri]
MLIARDGGCTKPCCTVGAYGCQVHHASTDWSKGGNTNINELGLACGSDNRSVDEDGGWSTRINDRGEVEWIPPPALDTGQARVNYYHRPEALLRPPDNETPTQPTTPAAPAPPAAPTDDHKPDAPAELAVPPEYAAPDDEAPAEPGALAEPVAPAEPAALAEPVAPAEPAALAEPVAPGEPALPAYDEPVAPAEPVTPPESEATTEPTAPEQPTPNRLHDTDVNPSQTATSHAPEGPDPPDNLAA